MLGAQPAQRAALVELSAGLGVFPQSMTNGTRPSPPGSLRIVSRHAIKPAGDWRLSGRIGPGS